MNTNRPNKSSSSTNQEPKPDERKGSITIPAESSPAGSLDVDFQLQHAGEARNPYPDLLAPLKTTSLINIHAYGAEVKSKSGARRTSLITPNGYIPSMKSMVPPLFSLAAAQVCKELGIPLVSMRTTAASIFTLPHAPKPPNAKYKTGKGGISDSIIPYDDNTITYRDATGKLLPLTQNEKYKPVLGKSIQLAHYAIPFEKIILGLIGRAPEFTVIDPIKTKKSGILELKVNCENSQLKNMVFQIDLKEKNIIKPIENQINIISQAGRSSMQPTWWDASFGDYKQLHKCGYHVHYKKDNEEKEFKKYPAYARKNKDGVLAVITGDQDLFAIPRPEKHPFGELATQVIDTKYERIDENDISGAELLSDKIKEIQGIILERKIDEMLRNNMPKIEIEQYEKSMRGKIQYFLETHIDYICNLGSLTAFEAYVIISINLRENELKQQSKINPDLLNQEIAKICMTPSVGLSEIIENNLDVDLHPAWFESNQDSENCIKHINSQLQLGRFISADILFLYMNKMNELLIDQLTVLYKTHASNEAIGLDLTQSFLTHLTINFSKINTLNWEVYIKNSKDEIITPILPQNFPKNATEVLIIMKEDHNKNIMHLKENQVNSTDKRGAEALRKALASISFDTGTHCIMSPENDEKDIPISNNSGFKI